MLPLLRKILFRSLYSLLFLAGLVLFAALVLTGTEGGTAFVLRTALDRAQQGSSLRIDAGEINGTFLGDLELQQLNVRDTATGLRVNAESLALSLVVADLFSSKVHLNYLQVRGLAITPPTSGSDEPADTTALLNTLFTLPVTVAVDDINIAPFTLSGEQGQTLQAITGMLQLDSNRALVNARLVRDEANWIAPQFSLAANDFTLDGTVSWAALAGEQQASGTLVINGDLEQLEVRHELTAPVAITTTGSVTTGLLNGEQPGFDLTHSATDIGGTPFGFPELEDFAGTFTIAGTTDRIRLSADAALRMSTLGNTGINLSALYADNTLAINSVALRNSAFEFDANGNADFDGGLTLNLAWQLRNFTDGDLLPQVVLENVNGNGAVTISTAGSTAGNQTAIELSLATLTGRLNGYPLSGNGEVAITDGAVNNVALELVSDVNSLLLEGSVTPQLDLLWEL